MNLSEELQQIHDSGDCGMCLKGPAKQAVALEQENAILRAIADAAENLIQQKGRHNTEVAYQRLADAVAMKGRA